MFRPAKGYVPAAVNIPATHDSGMHAQTAEKRSANPDSYKPVRCGDMSLGVKAHDSHRIAVEDRGLTTQVERLYSAIHVPAWRRTSNRI